MTYSDGGILPSNLHEELIGHIDLVLNPPPKLGISLGAAGGFTLGVNGSQGQTVVVEASTNLVTWQALATNTLTSDRWVYSDNQSASDAMRYYRASLR